MPAQRGRKIICAYRDPSPELKEKKPRAPRRTLTEEEKEKAAQLRAERKAKKELKIKWEETLKPWKQDLYFQWPKGTLAMYRSDAKKSYGLTDKEMSTLRYESIQNSPKTFYEHADVKALATRKIEAGLIKDASSLPATSGYVRTFRKTECNGRRTRKNWFDTGF